MKREPTHITAAQFVLMHEYCLTAGDIARTVQRSGSGYIAAHLLVRLITSQLTQETRDRMSNDIDVAMRRWFGKEGK